MLKLIQYFDNVDWVLSSFPPVFTNSVPERAYAKNSSLSNKKETISKDIRFYLGREADSKNKLVINLEHFT